MYIPSHYSPHCFAFGCLFLGNIGHFYIMPQDSVDHKEKLFIECSHIIIQING